MTCRSNKIYFWKKLEFNLKIKVCWKYKDQKSFLEAGQIQTSECVVLIRQQYSLLNISWNTWVSIIRNFTYEDKLPANHITFTYLKCHTFPREHQVKQHMSQFDWVDMIQDILLPLRFCLAVAMSKIILKSIIKYSK